MGLPVVPVAFLDTRPSCTRLSYKYHEISSFIHEMYKTKNKNSVTFCVLTLGAAVAVRKRSVRFDVARARVDLERSNIHTACKIRKKSL